MEITFLVSMHCASCKQTVLNCLNKLDGINNVDINLINNTVIVNYNENKIDKEIIKKKIIENGFRVSEYKDEDELINKGNRSRLIQLIKVICGVLLLVPLIIFSMGGMFPSIFSEFYKTNLIFLNGYLALFTVLIILGLFFNFYIDGFKALFKGHPDMNTLVFLSSLGSILYSLYITICVTISPTSYHFEHIHYFYDASGMVLVVVSIGKLIESYSKKKAGDTIYNLMKLKPKISHCLRDNVLYEVETKYLQVGDQIIVRAGENIPLDGVIINGSSYVDESMITGESVLVEKNEDDNVYAGTLNKDGVLRIVVTKIDKDSTINSIVKLVLKASNMKSKLTKTVDKVSSIFTPIVLGISVITFIIWLLVDTYAIKGVKFSMLYSSPFEEALGFAISVLTISCPCALGLATPISLLVGSSVFSKHGILINDSSAIEKILKCDALVLDKTNTITEGKLHVEKYIEFKKEEGINSVFNTLEKGTNHPFSEAILSFYNDNNILDEVTNITLISGKGIKGNYKNETYYVGSLSLAKEILPSEEFSKINIENTKNHLVSLTFSSSFLYGMFYLSDSINKESIKFIEKASKQFKVVSICSGDNLENVKKVANELGINTFLALSTPEKKKDYILSLKNEGYKTIMVGDGVNDAIALTLSDVSIGLAKGSDVALSSSDFILMNNSLNSLYFIIYFSKKIKNNIKFNLFWAFIYNLIMIPIASGAFAFLGLYLNPLYCSILMIVSSISVCLNSLLLFRFKKSKNYV